MSAIRVLNQWSITHMNGDTETILAENLTEALANLKTPISTSDVRKLEATISGARAYIKDIPDISWVAEVSDSTASSDGCQVYPTSGDTPNGDTIKVMASPSVGYSFDHWERNGTSVGTDRLLAVAITPLTEGEDAVIYSAVFAKIPSTIVVEGESSVAVESSITLYSNVEGVTWSVDNQGIATVVNGVVTGVVEGTAKITASKDGYTSGTKTITVTAKA